MKPIYEDNHIIIVSKQTGEIVQGDKTGDTPLSETVKDYIKVKYQKPGNVFLGGEMFSLVLCIVLTAPLADW